MTLNWKPNPEPDIEKYEIFRGARPQDIKENIKDISLDVNQYLDTKLKDGSTYYYKIRAVDKDGLEGKFCEPVEAKTKPIPETPEGLKVSLNAGQVKLTWRKNPEKDIAFYRIYEKDFFSWKPVGETADAVFVYNGEVKPGKTMTFRLIATDTVNLESEPSEEVSVEIPK